MASTLEQEIRAQEERLTEVTRNLDLDGLDGIYADDVLFTGVTGNPCGKSALMDEARRGAAERRAAAGAKPLAVSYAKDDVRIVAHGDTAVTSYRFVVTIAGEGQEIQHRCRTTNVWMKRGHGWQVIAGHTARLEGGAA